MIEIRIHGPLWDHLAPRVTLDVEGRDLSVADLLGQIGIKIEEVGIVTVDGRQRRMDELVPANGRVCIFPPLVGG